MRAITSACRLILTKLQAELKRVSREVQGVHRDSVSACYQSAALVTAKRLRLTLEADRSVG
jgi:hypothetical protein